MAKNHEVTTTIDGNEILFYPQKGNAPEIENLMNLISAFAKMLEVEVPYLSTADAIEGNGTGYNAKTFFPEDLLNFDGCIICLAGCAFDSEEIAWGTVAHEMRHIWQYVHMPDMLTNKAKDGSESFLNDAEIDADAFAIAVLHQRFKISIDEAARLFCPLEFEHSALGYKLRVEEAKKIKFGRKGVRGWLREVASRLWN